MEEGLAKPIRPARRSTPIDWRGTPIRKSERAAIDTNIIVYSFDARFPEKRDTAREILSQPDCVLSCQVLTESANVFMSKLGMNVEETYRAIQSLRRFEIVNLTPDIVERSLGIVATSPRKIWDALMFASAIEAGCGLLYSEDMGHGEIVAGVRIVNPFLP